MKVELADQVLEFVRALPQGPKRKLRLALRGLAEDKGDIKKLAAPLEGYFRLRIGSHRVIFRQILRDGMTVVLCDFAERRAVVYQQFTPPAN